MTEASMPFRVSLVVLLLSLGSWFSTANASYYECDGPIIINTSFEKEGEDNCLLFRARSAYAKVFCGKVQARVKGSKLIILVRQKSWVARSRQRTCERLIKIPAKVTRVVFGENECELWPRDERYTELQKQLISVAKDDLRSENPNVDLRDYFVTCSEKSREFPENATVRLSYKNGGPAFEYLISKNDALRIEKKRAYRFGYSGPADADGFSTGTINNDDRNLLSNPPKEKSQIPEPTNP